MQPQRDELQDDDDEEIGCDFIQIAKYLFHFIVFLKYLVIFLGKWGDEIYHNLICGTKCGYF